MIRRISILYEINKSQICFFTTITFLKHIIILSFTYMSLHLRIIKYIINKTKISVYHCDKNTSFLFR